MNTTSSPTAADPPDPLTANDGALAVVLVVAVPTNVSELAADVSLPVKLMRVKIPFEVPVNVTAKSVSLPVQAPSCS